MSLGGARSPHHRGAQNFKDWFKWRGLAWRQRGLQEGASCGPRIPLGGIENGFCRPPLGAGKGWGILHVFVRLRHTCLSGFMGPVVRPLGEEFGILESKFGLRIKNPRVCPYLSVCLSPRICGLVYHLLLWAVQTPPDVMWVGGSWGTEDYPQWLLLTYEKSAPALRNCLLYPVRGQEEIGREALNASDSDLLPKSEFAPLGHPLLCPGLS